VIVLVTHDHVREREQQTVTIGTTASIDEPRNRRRTTLAPWLLETDVAAQVVVDPLVRQRTEQVHERERQHRSSAPKVTVQLRNSRALRCATIA